MSDDAAFLAAIKAAPDASAARLAYADWLDEQGRPGGDFLRVECEIVALDPAESEQRAAVHAEVLGAGVVNLAPPTPLDTCYWQRVNLVAKLRCAARGLHDEWMAAVSRVPIDEINARVREIQSWLRRRVTVAELLAEAARLDWWADRPRTPWQWVARRLRRSESPEGPHLRASREWVEACLRPGDELWEYDTGGDTWAHMCGEAGYAIVRDGTVVEFDMVMMN
jgi:uncharacterized protein (TIGR02996 family)